MKHLLVVLFMGTLMGEVLAAPPVAESKPQELAQRFEKGCGQITRKRQQRLALYGSIVGIAARFALFQGFDHHVYRLNFFVVFLR